MQLHKVDFATDDEHVAALHRAHQTIDELGPRMTPRHFTVYIERGWAADPSETWVATSGGEFLGGLTLELPEHDNAHLTVVRLLVVAPEHRRKGVGGALLDQAIARSKALGRRVVIGEADAGGPGDEFAKARGATHGLTSARRVLDVRAVDWDALEAIRAEAETHAQGYVVECWVGPAPDDRLDDMVLLMLAMNDEPYGDLDIEDAYWDPARWRLHEEVTESAGLQTYTMIAKQAESGAPAGFTRVFIDPSAGDGWGRQADTAVVGGHRGHRLGTLLKIANLAWFHESEPSVERIVTWNAAINDHMVGINERMGYRLIDHWNEWQLSV